MLFQTVQVDENVDKHGGRKASQEAECKIIPVLFVAVAETSGPPRRAQI